MSILMLISIVVGVFVLFSLYGMYVQLIKKRNNAKEAMAGIDVQLRKRYDLIPNILATAAKFMEHEKGLMTEITQLRTQAASLRSDVDTIGKKIELDNAITSKLGQLFVSVENYPQLKSDQTMLQTMQTYSEVEEHIAAARRFYNSAVKDLNNSVEIFPSSLVAAIIGIKSCPFFETDETARQPISAEEYFNN